jgi:hypothetical protein
LRLRVELLRRLPRWLDLLHCDWTWLRIDELWLPEAWAKLIWHFGGNTHHGFLLLNSSNVLLGFWVPFGAMTSSVILVVKVWISWVMVCELRGSSSSSPSSGCKVSSCAWSFVLIGLGIFHVIDVSWVLELRYPDHFSVALSCFISFSNSSPMIIVGHDVFFKFTKKFINCFGFLSCEMRSCRSWSRTLDQCLNCCFIIRFGNMQPLLHESSYVIPQWLSVFLLVVVEI